MTNLLDLPPEVFQEIVHQLVVAGSWNAWKLREVCCTFAAEIQYNVYAKQTQKILNKDYMVNLVISNKSWLYIFYRTKVLLDARRDLPEKVVEMSDWLLENTTKPSMEPDELTEAVCKAVGDNLSLADFRAVMGFNNKYWSRDNTIQDLSKGLQISDKLAMASLLSDLPLLEKLLPQLLQHMRTWRLHWQFDSVFGDFLVHACRTGNVSVVHCLRKYVEAKQIQQDAAYSIIVDYYFRHHFLTVFSQAPYAAMANGHVDIVRTLLDLHKAHGTKLRKDTYNTWLDQAVRSGNAEFVRTFMRIKGVSQPRVLLSTFKRACSYQKAEVVSALLEKGGMPVNDAFSNWTPLVAAIRLGNDELVRAVLDAGADVNGVQYHYDELVIPLQVAVSRGDVAIIKSLLERGASARELNVPKWKGTITFDLIIKAKAQEDKHVSDQAQEKDS